MGFLFSFSIHFFSLSLSWFWGIPLYENWWSVGIRTNQDQINWLCCCYYGNVWRTIVFFYKYGSFFIFIFYLAPSFFLFFIYYFVQTKRYITRNFLNSKHKHCRHIYLWFCAVVFLFSILFSTFIVPQIK